MKNPTAFPTTEENDKRSVRGDIILGQQGMTLLDYFAGRAMQGLLASPKSPLDGNDEPPAVIRASLIANLAYETAKAMLEERERYLLK